MASEKANLLPEYVVPSDSPWHMRKPLWADRKKVIAAVGVLLMGFLTLGGLRGGSSTPSLLAQDVHNRTLGFQKAFVISMPARTDRRDMFTLASATAGFDIEFSDGVDGESILRKAAPTNWNWGEPIGALGCWRAHVNVLQKIVRERIQSAIIFEDDADFDVSLKQQLAVVAEGVSALQQGQPKLSSVATPYGSAWDMLWLGQCSSGSSDKPSNFYVVEKDPTVAPTSKRHGLFLDRKLPAEALRDDTRLMFKTTQHTTCMYAYALTYEGARKALAAISVIPQSDPVDQSYRKLISGELGMPFECYTTYPSLIGVHRPAGPMSKDSEINDWKETDMHPEYTFDMVYSMKQNMVSITAGNLTVPPQWSDLSLPEHTFGAALHTGARYLKLMDLRARPNSKVPGINSFRSGEWTKWMSDPQG